MDGIALKKRIPKGMVVKIWEQSIFLCSRDLKNLEVIFKSNDKKKKYQTVLRWNKKKNLNGSLFNLQINMQMA